MATFRVGVGSFNINDGTVGIGTEGSGHGNLKVEGTARASTIDVVGGASTFTRYSGFSANQVSVNDRNFTNIAHIFDKTNRIIELTGETQTTGDIIVDDRAVLKVGLGSTACVGSLEYVCVKNHFSVPTGGTNQRNSSVYVEGTIRYNTDLGTMEFFNGNEWRQFTYIADVQNAGSGGRAVFVGGSPATSAGNSVDTMNISTLGNATHFATLNVTFNQGGGCSNKTRGLIAGGENPSIQNAISYWNMQGGGTALDFGNLTGNRRRTQENGCSSSTRGMWIGGFNGSNTVNIIDYVEISTLGDAIDFGDINVGTRESGAAFSSPVRAIYGGGRNQPANKALDDIVFVNISSKGNTATFGNLTRLLFSQSGSANSVRGIFAGGGLPGGTYTDEIIYITMASEGNAVQFGNLSVGSQYLAATANQTRSLIAGGNLNGGTKLNTVEFITISSTGNAADFGDLTEVRQEFSGCSDSHGGLGGY